MGTLYRVHNRQLDELLATDITTQGGTPDTGFVMPFAGSTAPKGWLICDGSAVSRTTYSNLYSAIGITYGSGDGSTTFNLPDLREATPKGTGLSGKSSTHISSSGLSLGAFTNDRMKQHQHTYKTISVADVVTVNRTGQGSGYPVIVGDFVNKTTSAAGTGSTTEVKSVGVNFIIKT